MTTINTDNTGRFLFGGQSPLASRTRRKRTVSQPQAPPIDARRIALELEGLKLSRKLSCGCIPFIPASEARWNGTTTAVSTDEPIDKKTPVDPALLEGYISLAGRSLIYRKHIVNAYQSIRLGRSNDAASLAKLDLFIEEVEEILGEGKNKTNLIIEGLPGKPQAQLEAVSAAYEYLCSAIIKKSRFNDDTRRAYYISIWGTLLKLRTQNNNIDKEKLESLVQNVRPDQIGSVRQKLKDGSSWVALAIWIAREKANKELQPSKL